ncbi:MAG: hypothetical protein K1X42_11410, partial [Opitutaceae bacterium]|nr:hypothetical protein [Opitutaceae bacterium]
MRLFLLLAIIPCAIVAQVKPEEREPAVPNRYDVNNDGRVDAKDDEALRAEAAKRPVAPST